MEELTDEQVMSRFQKGDRSAFSTLVRRYQTPLYNFVMRHLRSRAFAEDIVQETFVRVVQNAVDFKHESRFSTWLYTIARNQCIDLLRKQALRRHPSLDQAKAGDEDEGPTLGEQIPDTTADVERGAEAERMRARISAAIASLPEDQREVFLLREGSNLPFKEIAEITGVPENTVKSRMRYALERLQAALSEFEDHAKALQ